MAIAAFGTHAGDDKYTDGDKQPWEAARTYCSQHREGEHNLQDRIRLHPERHYYHERKLDTNPRHQDKEEGIGVAWPGASSSKHVIRILHAQMELTGVVAFVDGV